jgi:peptidyl-tRNA hydrolase
MAILNHYPTKQVIIVRKDLNYGTKGKVCAQCAHASMAALLQAMNLKFFKNNIKGHCSNEVKNWLEGSFAKIVLSAPSDKELLNIIEEVKETNIPWAMIEDNGTTVFNGVKTLTAIALGPDKSDVIDTITHTKEYLKLL